MAISKRDVEYNAHLARLELTEKEKERFAMQLSSILGYFNKLGELDLKEIEPVYLYYLSCIEQDTSNGALLLGQQGGYIQQPEFSPGSEYMPFSSQLDFFGTGVPYWYYISGNGVSKEQVPSKEKMQSDLNDFVKARLYAIRKGKLIRQVNIDGEQVKKEYDLEV